MPGLLAEIERLDAELAVTEQALATTRADLTHTELALSAKSVELEASRAALDETLDLLEREQNTYRVPRTGQDQCWEWTIQPDVPHYTIQCASTGQDGETRAGLAPPVGRYLDNGDGTLTDRFTGLVWLRRADCADDFAGDLSWFDALGIVRQLSGLPGSSSCSLRDGSLPGQWRMPNVRELLSLVDFGTLRVSDDPTLVNGSPFIGVGGYFWSSTTWALPSDANVSGVFYPCVRDGHGQDNYNRFNEAYVVSINTGEVLHAPKQAPSRINRVHFITRESGGDLCVRVGPGFRAGEPGLVVRPGFMAVRDPMDR